jgi:hypothetical protein
MTVRITPLPVPAPIIVDDVFADTERVWRAVRGHAPYAPTGGYFRPSIAGQSDPLVPPHFRADWVWEGRSLVDGVAFIYEHERFIELAAALWNATIVEPRALYINLMMAQPEPLRAHTDVPYFRGTTREAFPSQLLFAMHASGLFEAWRPRNAHILTWFNDAGGGEFTYWFGSESPSRVSDPMSNRAIAGDLDRTFHRVEPIGTQDHDSRVRVSAQLVCDQGRWSVVDAAGSTPVNERDIRVSFVWKATVYRDADERERAANDPLSLAQALEILNADLSARGDALRLDDINVHDPAVWTSLTARYPQLTATS